MEKEKTFKRDPSKSDIIRFSDHVETQGKELFELIKKRQVEGIVAKHKDSLYDPGIRSKQWLKIKTAKEVQAVVAGYLFNKDKNGISSLIIGKPAGKNINIMEE